MGAAKAILIGGVGFGLAAWFFHSKSANASAGASTAPTPPPGATVDTFQNPMPGTGMPVLKRTSWHVPADASGQKAGLFVLTQNPANPNDWVFAFKQDGGGAGVIAYSQTPNGGLMAQAVASGQ